MRVCERKKKSAVADGNHRRSHRLALKKRKEPVVFAQKASHRRFAENAKIFIVNKLKKNERDATTLYKIFAEAGYTQIFVRQSISCNRLKEEFCDKRQITIVFFLDGPFEKEDFGLDVPVGSFTNVFFEQFSTPMNVIVAPVDCFILSPANVNPRECLICQGL